MLKVKKAQPVINSLTSIITRVCFYTDLTGKKTREGGLEK